MMLLIDAGNTRIKWALVEGLAWLHSGVLPVAQAGELSQHIVGHCVPWLGSKQALPSSGLQGIEQIWVSNVAGEETARHIRNIGTNKNVELHFVAAQLELCGVRNGYSQAGQLGSDRWAALIAAWKLVRRECLVVNCGTAITIDAIDGNGAFEGGLILPGVELMKSSLCATTAQLSPGPGEYVPFPTNTSDAMYSGAIQAGCGAIQRQHGLLLHSSSPVVMSGGSAGILDKHLNMPLRIVDNLVLQGLLIIAQEANET